MGKKKRSSILFEFLMSVLLVIILLITYITYNNINLYKKQSMENVLNSADYIGLSLNKLAQEALIYGMPSRFEDRINKLNEHKEGNIHEISIYKLLTNDKVFVFYSTNKEKQNKIYKIDGIEKKLKKQEEKIAYLNLTEIKDKKIETYDYIMLLKRNDRILGTLNIIMSLENVNNDNKKIFISNAIISVVSILIIVLMVTFILLKRVYRPIKNIEKEISKIEAGEIAYRAKFNVNNEFKELSDRIIQMKDSLWERTFEDRFSNPVTGLPGLVQLIEKVNDKIEKEERFTLISMSIKNTEPYILEYGISHGEDILRFVTGILYDVFEELKIEDYYISQVREMTFFILAAQENSKNIADLLVRKFDEDIKAFYSNKNNNGKISFKNSTGEEKEYLMLTLMISMANSTENTKTYKEIEDNIFKVEKTYYDSIEESTYIMFNDELFGKAKEKIENKSEEKDFKMEEMEEIEEVSSNEDEETTLLDGLGDL